MKKNIYQFNYKIFIWARETAGLSQETAAKKLNIKLKKLQSIESGESAPTQTQLKNMSDKYRRALVVFYLKDIPKKGDRGQDFRKLPNSIDNTYNHLTDALIRNIKTKQSLVRSVLEEESNAVRFIGSIKKPYNKENIANIIKEEFGVDIQQYRLEKNTSRAFQLLRKKVESRGIFVLLCGDLGSHHTDIPVTAFRGFADADHVAPFIVINDNDNNPARTFTLLHELTHLGLGESGISGSYIDVNNTEKLCNDVAADILLPAHDLSDLSLSLNDSIESNKNKIINFSKDNHLNQAMVSYRLLVESIISKEMYESLIYSFKESIKYKPQKGGPSYNTIKRYNLGALVDFVANSIRDGSLTRSKGAKVLGVRAVTSLDYLIFPSKST